MRNNLLFIFFFSIFSLDFDVLHNHIFALTWMIRIVSWQDGVEIFNYKPIFYILMTAFCIMYFTMLNIFFVEIFNNFNFKKSCWKSTYFFGISTKFELLVNCYFIHHLKMENCNCYSMTLKQWHEHFDLIFVT